MIDNLAEMRREYAMEELDETSADRNPFALLGTWIQRAKDLSMTEANAMVLATVDQHGHPSARSVLLKGLDERGLVFFTNYDSRKGRDIRSHAEVALVFTWLALERQVRIEGTAEPVSSEESDAYFASRPRGSQIGAVASPQSEPVPDRGWLESRFERMESDDEEIARPANWGGYRVAPRMFEFWQGRPSRLHDRLRYDRTPHGWEIVRLAP